jgi:Tol biopolymer transport system component/DNA-binding winged helix-turn-helix (wHTH) protein
MVQQANPIYEFGPFLLDLRERLLLKNGQTVPLTPKAFDTLLVLVQNSGHVLEKDELMKEVWPDSFVEEVNLAHNISVLRKALGEAGDKFIETVPKRGYRFVAGVRELGDDNSRLLIKEHSRSSVIIEEEAIRANVWNRTAWLRRNARWKVLAAVVVFIALAAIGFWLYRSIGKNKPEAAFQTMKITRLTNNGKATAAAISPDGKYVVHAVEDAGRQSLRLRQVATASDKEIVPPAPVVIKGPTFSVDGNLIYYTASERGEVFTDGVLYQVPTLGGTPRKLLARVASPITLSPDGRRFAFVRDDEGLDGGTALIVANVDGTAEHVIARYRDNSYLYLSGPAWSPDGHIIACGAGIGPNHLYETVVAVSVEDGTERSITQGWLGPVERVAWLKDGSGLIVIANPDVTTGSQIYHVSYPSGEVRRITNDLSGYGTHSLTLAADSASLVAVQEETTSKIWVMAPNEDASRARQIANGRLSGSWTPDGRIVFPKKTGDNRDLWVMDQDGTNQKQLTADPSWEAYPMFSPDGRYVVFNSDRAIVGSQIWRLDADGSNPKQLTEGNAQDYSPRFTPDGLWVVFFSWRSGKLATWKVSSNGGEPVQLISQTSVWPAVSHDGKLIACGYHDEQAGTPWQLAVFSIEGGQPVKLLDVPPSVNFATGLWWTPDSSAVVYADTRNGVSNIWSRPIDGGKPVQLTNFESDLIFKFALSPDGKRLAVARGIVTNDVVLIRDLR